MPLRTVRTSGKASGHGTPVRSIASGAMTWRPVRWSMPTLHAPVGTSGKVAVPSSPVVARNSRYSVPSGGCDGKPSTALWIRTAAPATGAPVWQSTNRSVTSSVSWPDDAVARDRSATASTGLIVLPPCVSCSTR
jgi:hypothetical protein